MPTILRLRAQAVLVLAACLAALAASLSLTPPARADALDCYGAHLVVDGPNGSSTTQPPGAIVLVKLVNVVGTLVPTTCQGDELYFTWSSPSTYDFDFGAWPLTASVPTNQVVIYGHKDDEDVTLNLTTIDQLHVLAVGGTVTLHFADPGPSGTTLAASPSAPVAGNPVTLTAGTTSVTAIDHWSWDFGDGNTTSSDSAHPSVDHNYAAGDYTATVTVTDLAGKSDSATTPVHVAAPPAALAPAFSLSPSSLTTGQSVSVDGTGSSTDPSGRITGWAWDFGDGGTASGVTATHPYSSAGSYTVTETVTDSLGRTATTSHTVTVQDPGTPGGPPVTPGDPHAAWSLATVSPIAGTLTAFDGTGSTDDGATIVSYAWNFGDGLTGAGASPRHSYADGGSYPVTLTVTDDGGHTSSATHQISVAYAPPVAAFTAPATPVVGAPASYDGTASSVPAPGAATYAWTFGDGATATGPTVTHAFPAAVSYPVTLTVTDSAGRSASVTHVVTAQWAPTDLAVSVGGSVPKAGRYTYRVTVKNLGRAGAHGVVLTNTLDPTQVLAVKASAPAGLTCGGVALKATGTITCRAGASAMLAPGKSWVVTFTVTQPSAPRVRMVSETSTVSATNQDPVGVNNSATRSTVLAVKQ